jgi:hypothetical protein
MATITIDLTDDELDRLRRIASREGKAEAEVLKAALDSYDVDGPPLRSFALDGCVTGDGTSAADIPEEEYHKGFGES